MLRILRNKKTAKKVWIILAIIIIPAFTFWGFGGAARNRQEAGSVGKIFGHNVSNLELRDSLTAVRTSAIIQFGDKLPEIEKYLDFPSQAWERLILLYEAKRRRITVNNKEVVEEIQNTPYFQDQSGFNNKTYAQTLRYVFRLQPRIYEEQVRQSLTLLKLYKQLTQNVKLTDSEIREEYLKANEELSIDYIASLFADFVKGINPTEKEIAEYFEKNKAMFKEPPSPDKPAHIPELTEVKNKVKEALIKETSESNAEQKINECAEKLKSMEFNQAAGACGLKVSSTDFFKSDGEIEGLGKTRIFWENAKKLKNGQPSPVLYNTKGCYIIKPKANKPIDEAKFTKEKSDFSKKILSDKESGVFAKFVAELKKKAQ
jgi:hypothetical protein